MADRDAAVASGALPPLEAYLAAGEKRGLLWTPLRRRLLELFWREPVVWGAYGVTRRLLKESKAHANSVYRGLRSLEEVSLIAPVHLLKRYLITPDPGRTEWSALLCDRCGDATLRPMPPAMRDIHALAATHGFSVSGLVVECVGQCRRCAREEPRAPPQEPWVRARIPQS
ncbi:MAG TPA: hypothetical protein VMG08_19360 [Allosphingosinicella sp.]|nr:hypothetical protein [Allosphingosinicella sp.]